MMKYEAGILLVENEMACATDVFLLPHNMNVASMASSCTMEMKPYENL